MSFDGVAEPTRAAVADAASAALDREVAAVEPFPEGMNAVYRVAFERGADAVVKVGTYASGPELLSGPPLLDRLAHETDVPVPEVLAVVPETDGPLDDAFYCMSSVDGRRTADVRDLSPAAHERFAREAGRHLAALHDLPYDGPFGHLVADDGELVPGHAFDDWEPAFRAMVEYRLDRFEERVDDRFHDLEPAFRDALAAFANRVADRAVDRSVCYRDYHAKNVVFDPSDDADPVVRAVVDWNFRPAGDAPLDLAVAEMNLVDFPVGDAERADELRSALRTAYVDVRGGAVDDYVGEVYPCYRLLPALDHLIYFEYFWQFAPGDDRAAAADRLRSFALARVDELA